MKGLLVKDFYLLFQRKRFFAILVVWALFMGYTMSDPGFAVGWLCIIMTIMSLSTLSYDEYDNGMPFLMSLPVSPREYAIEKYVFGFSCGAAGWLAAIVIEVVLAVVKHNTSSLADHAETVFVYIFLILIVLSLSIPLELKFGAEEGRTYLLVVYGIIFVIFYTAIKVTPLPVDPETFFSTFNPVTAFLIGLAITAGITAASLQISMAVMDKKEF